MSIDRREPPLRSNSARATAMKRSTSSGSYPSRRLRSRGKVDAMADMMHSGGREVEEQRRRGRRKDRIEAVEDPAVARQPRRHVLHADVPLDHRLPQVAEG